MAEAIIDLDEIAAKLARRKAQKKAATDRFFAKQKAAGNRYHADWYAKNRVKRLSERKIYYEANQEKIVRDAADYRLANPERITETQAKSRSKHRSKLATNARSRRVARHHHTREIEKRSRLKHHKERLISAKIYRLRRRGVPGSYSSADIVRLFAAQRGLCAYCRKSIKRFYHVDHITAISKGGTNWPKNLQLTCALCNLRKHAKDPIAFAQEIGRLL